MPHQLLILCPICHAEDRIGKTHCQGCGQSVTISKDGVRWPAQRQSIPEYYRYLQEHLSIAQTAAELHHCRAAAGLATNPAMLRLSKPAVLRQGRDRIVVRGYRGLFRRIIPAPSCVDRGRLAIFPEELRFYGEKQVWTWRASEISCVTTDGHYFEFKVKGQPFVQIEFGEESALKYEILLRKWLDNFYREARQDPIIEYQPRLRTALPAPGWQVWHITPKNPPLRQLFLEKWLTKLAALAVNIALRLWIRVEVAGREHWAKDGVGFVLVNHQSALDPFIVSACLDRRIAFLTKSSAFTHRLQRWFLGWVMGLPTTRFQTDSAIVRIMQTMLKQGFKVGVFPEGERCWDGQLAPFKLSLVKIIMAARMPVYPVILENVFDFWPRWSRFPRRAKVKISVHPPFCLLPGPVPVDVQRRFLEGIFLRSPEGAPTPALLTVAGEDLLHTDDQNFDPPTAGP